MRPADGDAGGGRAAFIRAETRVRAVPLVPEVRIHAADDATALWGRTEAELAGLRLPPPYWAFAWAGGQALARHVLDNPGLVRGLRALDFASGSGLVGIAAALAGARAVEAADLDAFALEAIGLNAALNGAALAPRGDNLVGRDEGWDAVLVADVFYEQDTARAVTAWLGALARRGARVLVGDPGRAYLDASGFEALAAYDVPVMRSLEDADTKRARVWRVRG